MSEENMKIWNAVARPPKDALKQIVAGRLKGMTDIKPQWRYQALTEQFGPIGFGWTYETKRTWTEPGVDGEVMVFVEIDLFVQYGGQWSKAIPGVGGSTLIAKERAGLHASDEAIKMATTDALSVSCKMLGVGADIYAGRWDGSKYKEQPVAKGEKEDLTKWTKSQLAEVVRGFTCEGDFAAFQKKEADAIDKELGKDDATRFWEWFQQERKAKDVSL